MLLAITRRISGILIDSPKYCHDPQYQDYSYFIYFLSFYRVISRLTLKLPSSKPTSPFSVLTSASTLQYKKMKVQK